MKLPGKINMLPNIANTIPMPGRTMLKCKSPILKLPQWPVGSMVNVNGFPVCVFKDFLALEELLDPAETRVRIILFIMYSPMLFICLTL